MAVDEERTREERLKMNSALPQYLMNARLGLARAVAVLMG